jgi:hypothetical protein
VTTANILSLKSQIKIPWNEQNTNASGALTQIKNREKK